MEAVISTDNSELLGDLLSRQRKRALELRTEKIHSRKEKLRNLKRWILKHRESIHDALYKDFQKPVEETDFTEIYVVLSEIRQALWNLSEWVKPKKVDTPLPLLGTRSVIQYEPKGTCLIMAPWNFPFNLTIGPLVSAIAAGNTAILKPSEMTPHTSALINTMITELFPPEEVSVVEGGIEASKALLALPFDHIFFTGSPKVGKIVMEAAAKNLTSVTLELGGKSPAIVDETASISDAAQKIVAGKFMNNGQTCIAPDYLLVHEKVKEKLIGSIVKETINFYDPEGNGIENSRDYGRLVNDTHFQRIKNMIEDEVAEGAKVEMGGKFDVETRFIAPTLISDVSENSALLREEIFGPVLPLISFTDLDEVLTRINSEQKPLALYFFSRKNARQKKVLNSSSSGTACINECVIQFLNPNLPFGGVNNSGLGKSHGYFGFLAFSNEKAVLRQRVGFTTAKLLAPPYTRFSKMVIGILLRYF